MSEIRLQIALVEYLSRTFGVKKFNFYGHSGGGLVAMAVAQERPELTATVGLSSPKVDDAGEALQLRPPHRLGPPIPRGRRIAQHLLHRATVDPEPPARLPVAQTLLDNRKSNPRIELHAIHPPSLATTDMGP